MGQTFLTYETEFVLFLAVLENSVLPMGRQLTGHAKTYVKTLNLRSDVTSASSRKTVNDVRRRLLCDEKCQKQKKLQMINNNFYVIGKKNNQTLVSDAD